MGIQVPFKARLSGDNLGASKGPRVGIEISKQSSKCHLANDALRHCLETSHCGQLGHVQPAIFVGVAKIKDTSRILAERRPPWLDAT